MKIGVTGCYGFIASHTIEELHRQGHEVIGMSRHIPDVEPGDYLPDMLYVGDLKDKEFVEKFVQKCDAVINLAGILGTKETVNNPFPSIEVNILGGLNVLEACRIWGVPLVQIAVGNHWMNNSYSITRTTCERFCLMYAKEHNVKVNVVRALNAFGPRQSIKPVQKIIPTFITKALKNEDIPVFGDGTSEMDMIYVKDLAEILVKVLAHTINPILIIEDLKARGGFPEEYNLGDYAYGNIYEAGTGVGLQVKDIAQKIIGLAGSTSQIKFLPMRAGEEKNSKVIAGDPYPFKYTSFDDAIVPTINYYKDLK